MSRIGRQPVVIPAGVEVSLSEAQVTVNGKQGTLEQPLPAGIRVAQEENSLVVTRTAEDKRTRSLHGLIRSLLSNHVLGVTEGYVKQLEIVGVSYQAAMSGNTLALKVGYANEIRLTIPEGVKVDLPNPTALSISGADKQKVGQFAAEVRAARPPEPYKGKGVRYRGEHIQRKQGKSFVGGE